MTESLFGRGADKLAPGAHNAVDVCLAIQPGEQVALIADEASGEVAASLAAVLDEVGAPWKGVLIEQVASRPLTVAPPEVLNALVHADAGILCVQPRQGELGARMAIVSVVERRGIRYAHMVDHAAGDVRGLSSRRPAEPAAVRAHAAGHAPARRNAGRHGVHRDLRSSACVGQDERSHQPPLLVQPAGGRGVHHSGHRRRRLRLRRHGRRLLRAEVRRPARHAAHARDCGRTAPGRPLRARGSRARILGLLPFRRAQ